MSDTVLGWIYSLTWSNPYHDGAAWLRSGPGRSFPGVAIPEGSRLVVLAGTPTPDGAAWLPVQRPMQTGELRGWIFSDLCPTESEDNHVLSFRVPAGRGRAGR